MLAGLERCPMATTPANLTICAETNIPQVHCVVDSFSFTNHNRPTCAIDIHADAMYCCRRWCYAALVMVGEALCWQSRAAQRMTFVAWPVATVFVNNRASRPTGTYTALPPALIATLKPIPSTLTKFTTPILYPLSSAGPPNHLSFAETFPALLHLASFHLGQGACPVLVHLIYRHTFQSHPIQFSQAQTQCRPWSASTPKTESLSGTTARLSPLWIVPFPCTFTARHNTHSYTNCYTHYYTHN